MEVTEGEIGLSLAHALVGKTLYVFCDKGEDVGSEGVDSDHGFPNGVFEEGSGWRWGAYGKWGGRSVSVNAGHNIGGLE